MMDKFRLMQGDCLGRMQEIEDQSVDMVLCDLPYGFTDCRWDSIIDIDALFDQYKRIAKPTAAIVLTASQPFTSRLINSRIKQFKCCWYVEDVCVFGFGTPKYYPQGLRKLEVPRHRGEKKLAAHGECVYDYGTTKNAHDQYITGYPNNVLRYHSERGLHPTQKPVPLFEYLVLTYSAEGDTVLDNCMGSGTAGVACAKTGRRFIGIEMSPEYFEVSSKRISEAYGKV